MIRALLTVLLITFAGPVNAATAAQEALGLTIPMVADASQSAIEIRTSFNGAQVLIFGARNVPGEIVIAVRGPNSHIRMRRKERIAGMWMNVEQQKYYNLPLFFALASSKPIESILPDSARTSLVLGIDKITDISHAKLNPVFDSALENILRKKRWWQAPFGTVEYFGESLFKVRLDMPDSLPGGEYTVELYLFHDGQLRATQVIPITVYKVGLEADLVKQANRNGFLYGLAAVLMALFGGWLAHRLFHRR